MITFTDLINAGIAKGPYETDIVPSDSIQDDQVCRVYNNFWGIVTDTHMSMMEDGRRVVSGSFVGRRVIGDYAKHVFCEFLCSPRWGACEFPFPFVQVLERQGLTWKYEIINGAEVCVFEPKEVA